MRGSRRVKYGSCGDKRRILGTHRARSITGEKYAAGVTGDGGTCVARIPIAASSEHKYSPRAGHPSTRPPLSPYQSRGVLGRNFAPYLR